MYLDAEQREQIGFSYVMDKLEVITPYGLERKKNIRPYKKGEESELNKELDKIEYINELLKKDRNSLRDIERIFYKLKDIKSSIKRCSNLNILDDLELFEIKYFAILNEELNIALKGLKLNMEGIKLNTLEGVISILDPEGKKIPTFYIYEKYSEKLSIIRYRKKCLEDEILKETDEAKIKALKEERLIAVIEEEEEELNIRKKLTHELSDYAAMLEENAACIGSLDFIIAKAKLALNFGGVRSGICSDYSIKLEDAFNPEVISVLDSKSKRFTPISIELSSGTTVITGANMGGKSVTLKTLVLNLLLAQCGFFIFCKSGELPIVDFIHFISDDMQSISKGLSTFGAEIIKFKEVIEELKKGTGFVALDEFARGTNPKEGYYLVKSICKYLNTFSSISLVSTHYDNIVEDNMTHYQVVGLKNADINSLRNKIDLNRKYSVELIQEYMEYSLEKVSKESKVPKDALNIAILLGLDQSVIDIAEKFYCEDSD